MIPARLDPRVTLVLKGYKVCKAITVQQVRLDRKGYKVTLDQQGLKDLKGFKVTRVHRVSRDRRVNKDCRAIPVQQVPWGLKARKVTPA